MKSNNSLFNWLIILLALSPLIYLASIWSSLPGIIPVHYDLNFKPDKMGSKNSMWIWTAILSGVSLLVYFSLTNIRKFDPKQRKLPPSSTFTRLAVVIAVFVTILNFLILIAVKDNTKAMGKLLFPLLGLLFAFIGNYMVNLKPNYFAGIRLPWTLSSDYNWKKTHQFAGKLWFWAGLISAALCLFFPQFKIIFFGILIFIILIPIIYSYRIYKEEFKNVN